jgi:REP element-mobilizing transposase RayT
MRPEPLYRAADLHAAYQLRYGWTAWPSATPFPTELISSLLSEIGPAWEHDGIRVLQNALSAKQIQLTVSTTPQVAPVVLAARLKGRLQHHARLHGTALDFSRKLAVRSLGDPRRTAVEVYIRDQLGHAALADERFQAMLTAFTVTDPAEDLAAPTCSNSGRYWYNLHLVLVASERYRTGEATILAKMRDTALRICAKKGYRASRLAVLPDHLHMGLRGIITQSPEEIALAFLNNLAHVLARGAWWEAGYYAGTFGEYSMAAVRTGREKEE